MNSFPAFKAVLGKLVAVLFVLALFGGAWVAVHRINTESDDASLVREEPTAARGDSSLLELPDGKVDAGGFQSEAIGPRRIQHVHVVPGRIRYDETKHIEVKAPISGVLSEMLVKPGDRVEAGRLVAVISSPEIGRARAEVLKCRAQREIVQRQFDRQAEVAANLKQLLSQLDSHAEVRQLDEQFADLPLGSYRQLVEPAYARFQLARALVENVRPLAESGSIAGRTIREREAEFQIARAEYRSAREQAAFEATQAELEARAELDDAERLLRIARQQLESLLGQPEEEVTMDSELSLSRLEIRAPFASTVESRLRAAGERLEVSDPIFILADTSSLYIEADIRENDWPAVMIETGTEVTVTVPAIPDRRFLATVHYIGREVAAETNAVPLVATIDNSEGLLRPGTFVRVALPVGPARTALAVRPESILQTEDQQFVFVALADDRFQKVAIATGLVSDDWVEVEDGLSEGQQVVGKGAFLLKSELLLEGQAE